MHFHSIESMEKVRKKPWKQLIDPESDYLILILRNYRESMLRHYQGDYNRVISHLEDDSNDPLQLSFFSNLQHFDEWPEKRKILIYYEDLLQFPKRELGRFIRFLNAPWTRYNNFIKDIEKHKQKTINLYNQGAIKRKIKTPGSQSEGKDFLYHSKKVPQEYLHQMDFLAKERAPNLYDKYLLRYKTKPND